jgi:hypothetical protein
VAVTSDDPSATVLDRLIEALGRAARYVAGAEEPPAVVLWPDGDGEWRPLLSRLRARLPQLLTLGPFDPEARTGPAIWVKCVLAGTLPEPKLPESEVPILYLPGVARQTLRATEECPRALQPLVELLYRGTIFLQKNGKDWTAEAFLVAADGLGLEVARDARAREAMLGALEALCETRVATLAEKPLDAEDFDRLLVEDPERDLLSWLSEPEARRAAWDEARWSAFRARCRAEYGFDPESDGPLSGGEKLGLHGNERWKKAWRRFGEAPKSFPGIPSLLRRARPAGQLALDFDPEPWPDENERGEQALRAALSALAALGPAEARAKIWVLEASHGARRAWVWARLGESPLACALEALARLAERTETALGGDDCEAMAALHRERGWSADEAALTALAEVSRVEDVQAVGTALRAIYLPWLEASAERFQQVVEKRPLPARGALPVVAAGEGECVVFVDGLRYDLGVRLVAALDANGLEVENGWRWGALPTITANAKPAVSPLAGELAGSPAAEGFRPSLAAAPLTTARLRGALEQRGYQILDDESGDEPAHPKARGWTEIGELDELGHALSAERFARALAEEVGRLAARVESLLEAGWKRVRIVTDHGWLLLPGGLAKASLPAGLAAERGARCARLAGEPTELLPRFPWHWDNSHSFATPAGARAFVAGTTYAHGGVSLEECVLPDLRVWRRAGPTAEPPAITEVRWSGLRCRVRVGHPPPGARIDLRRQAMQAQSSVAAEAKLLDAEGGGALLVPNDTLAGEAVLVVLIDTEGRVLAKTPTAIGGDR